MFQTFSFKAAPVSLVQLFPLGNEAADRVKVICPALPNAISNFHPTVLHRGDVPRANLEQVQEWTGRAVWTSQDSLNRVGVHQQGKVPWAGTPDSDDGPPASHGLWSGLGPAARPA